MGKIALLLTMDEAKYLKTLIAYAYMDSGECNEKVANLLCKLSGRIEIAEKNLAKANRK